MVGLSLVVSLVAAAASALAADAQDEKVVKTIVPGAYIFELEAGHVSCLFRWNNSIRPNGVMCSFVRPRLI